ncbi:unnamed protein product, partial [Polarella glacialis]
ALGHLADGQSWSEVAARLSGMSPDVAGSAAAPALLGKLLGPALGRPSAEKVLALFRRPSARGGGKAASRRPRQQPAVAESKLASGSAASQPRGSSSPQLTPPPLTAKTLADTPPPPFGSLESAEEALQCMADEVADLLRGLQVSDLDSSRPKRRRKQCLQRPSADMPCSVQEDAHQKWLQEKAALLLAQVESCRKQAAALAGLKA